MAVQVETLARAVLKTPIEIQVGGRSVVNSDISQSVEIRPVEDRFLRQPLPRPPQGQPLPPFQCLVSPH